MLGNPPYVQLQKNGGQLANQLEKQNFKVFERTGDIYCLFYEKGVNLLKAGGTLCYITSNKWLRAGYGKKLRAFLAKLNPQILIDLGPNVFETATVDTNILIVQNCKNQSQLYAVSVTENKDNLHVIFDLGKAKLSDIGENAWFIGNEIDLNLKRKIEKIGKPLREWDININYGIKTGLNEAFVINQSTYNDIVARDYRSVEILKPMLRGRDIEKYVHNWAGLYLIQTGYDIDIPKLYPCIYSHLNQHEIKAKKRYDQGKNWWNLRACDYYDEFNKEKLIWQEISSEPSFAYDNIGTFCNDTCRIMTAKNIKFFVGFFNSKFFKYVFSHYYAGGELGANGIRFKSTFMLSVPIAQCTVNQEIEIISIVDKIIEEKQANLTKNTNLLEAKLNTLIYNLYNLTEDEIRLIEG